MSKLRQHVPPIEGDLSTPHEGDLAPYVIFTRLKDDGPNLYAGWLDAVDDAMALQFAREHYGQDQRCVRIWAIHRDDIAGTDPEFAPLDDPGAPREYQVFRQAKAGDGMISTGTVHAANGEEAVARAREQEEANGPFHHLWVVPVEAIAATEPGDLIWRHSDQSYRMASGYAKDVRAKWEEIRKKRDLEEYEKDDLKETF